MKKIAISAVIVLGAAVVGYVVLQSRAKTETVPEQQVATSSPESVAVPVGDLSTVTRLTFVAEGLASLPQPDDKSEDGVNTDGEAPQATSVSIEAIKTGTVWQIVKPVDAVGDGEMITQFLKGLESLSANGPALDHPTGRAAIGDAQPTLTIGLTLPGAAPTETGDTTADSDATETEPSQSPELLLKFVIPSDAVGKVYLTLSSTSEVYVLDAATFASLQHREADFMSKALVHIDEASIRNLTLKGKNRELTDFVRTEAGFSMTRPEANGPSDSRVKQFLADLNDVRYTDLIVSPAESLVALFEAPDYTILWETTAGVATNLYAVEAQGELYAAYRPHRAIYKIPLAFKDKLKAPASDFLTQ